ncbi:MAG TPA: glycosyltransferase family 2 protein [Solirubrobacteraceae bacterium]|nr:glycosyltransferase family 2 protein [Solirubrobacteraceae bacterium]
MTLVVRDEEDILETNLRYHLDQGVDFIYAVDHNSSDGTPDILREFERAGVLRFLREEDEVHDQGRRVTNLARLAHAELKADWVINNDADEFWWPVAGSLKDVLGAYPDRFGKLLAWRHDFLPRPDSGAPFYEAMIWRRAKSLTPSGTVLEPKAAHRGGADVVITPGNHDALGTLEAAPLLPFIEVLHFPARSYEQFERKIRHLGHGYELLTDRDPAVGRDQLKLLELLRAGELRPYFDRWVVPEAELIRGAAEGLYVKDERLRRFLSDPPPRARERGESQQVAELTRRAVAALANIEDAERARAEATSQLEAERAAHAHTTAALAESTHTLEVIRSSKLFRWTSAVRKRYYRLRR